MVVLSGFQRYFCMQYTTKGPFSGLAPKLFYQDFKDTFVCNTQLSNKVDFTQICCFIRISKILLYAIHNAMLPVVLLLLLFYQDFKDTFVCNTQLRAIEGVWNGSCFIRISKILLYAIHNRFLCVRRRGLLFYQDFKDTFVCNTQPSSTSDIALKVVLSGFQRYFCMQYTTANNVNGVVP